MATSCQQLFTIHVSHLAQAAGMTNALVASIDSAVISRRAQVQPPVTDAAAAAIGILGSGLVIIVAVMCFYRPRKKHQDATDDIVVEESSEADNREQSPATVLTHNHMHHMHGDSVDLDDKNPPPLQKLLENMDSIRQTPQRQRVSGFSTASARQPDSLQLTNLQAKSTLAQQRSPAITLVSADLVLLERYQ